MSTHLTRIRRYAPEICNGGGSGDDLPWASTKELAAHIKTLGRQDLLDAWDRTVLPGNCSRIASMVYGSSFPLTTVRSKYNVKTINNKVSDALALRKMLPPYDDKPSAKKKLLNSYLRHWTSNRSLVAIAAASFVGAGFLGWALMTRSKKRSM